MRRLKATRLSLEPALTTRRQVQPLLWIAPGSFPDAWQTDDRVRVDVATRRDVSLVVFMLFSPAFRLPSSFCRAVPRHDMARMTSRGSATTERSGNKFGEAASVRGIYKFACLSEYACEILYIHTYIYMLGFTWAYTSINLYLYVNLFLLKSEIWCKTKKIIQIKSELYIINYVS